MKDEKTNELVKVSGELAELKKSTAEYERAR